MVLANGQFGMGQVVSPLATGTGNSLLEDADPVLFHLLAYVSGVIGLHIGPRWNPEVTAAGLAALANKPVAYKTPVDPLPLLQEKHVKFPMLAIYRPGETYTKDTSVWDSVNSNIVVMWTLPPLTPAQAERLSPFRKHVASTVRERLLVGYDSNWNGGLNVHEAAGISKIVISGASYGSIPDLRTEDLFFPSVQVNMTVSERKQIVTSNYNDLEGVSTTIEVDASDDEATAVIELDTNNLQEE